jgi:hypothetical protein
MQEKNKIETVGLSDRAQILYFLLIFGYLFIGLFGYIFHETLVTHNYKKLSALFVIIFPIIMITYSTIYHVNYQEEHTDEESLEEAEKELQTEKSSTTIPVILFGLGVLLTKISNQTKMKAIIPYLVSALLFGTIMTELVSQNIFNHFDLTRVIIAAELNYMFTSMAFGLIVMSIILTLINL